MSTPLSDVALDQLFRNARSRNAWRAETLPDQTWKDLYDLLKFGPTSANLSPARFVFVTTTESKARLAPHLSESNRTKSLDAPCIAIIGHDLKFADRAAELFPHNPGVGAWFASPEVAELTAPAHGHALDASRLPGRLLVVVRKEIGRYRRDFAVVLRLGQGIEQRPDIGQYGEAPSGVER